MATRLNTLSTRLREALGEKLSHLVERSGELTAVIGASDAADALLLLREDPQLRFEILIDVCGVDYSEYRNEPREGKRFAVVYHLLSVSLNHRLRVRVFCESDDFPVVASAIDVWPAANWFEREAFDLYGIVFTGHPDLRRILTDYGFIGHPFRKDFPLSGNVEMRYDPDQQRVIYQPVSIEPREVTPRILREEHYGDVK